MFPETRVINYEKWRDLLVRAKHLPPGVYVVTVAEKREVYLLLKTYEVILYDDVTKDDFKIAHLNSCQVIPWDEYQNDLIYAEESSDITKIRDDNGKLRVLVVNNSFCILPVYAKFYYYQRTYMSDGRIAGLSYVGTIKFLNEEYYQILKENWREF